MEMKMGSITTEQARAVTDRNWQIKDELTKIFDKLSLDDQEKVLQAARDAAKACENC